MCVNFTLYKDNPTIESTNIRVALFGKEEINLKKITTKESYSIKAYVLHKSCDSLIEKKSIEYKERLIVGI